MGAFLWKDFQEALPIDSHPGSCELISEELSFNYLQMMATVPLSIRSCAASEVQVPSTNRTNIFFFTRTSSTHAPQRGHIGRASLTPLSTTETLYSMDSIPVPDQTLNTQHARKWDHQHPSIMPLLILAVLLYSFLLWTLDIKHFLFTVRKERKSGCTYLYGCDNISPPRGQ